MAKSQMSVESSLNINVFLSIYKTQKKQLTCESIFLIFVRNFAECNRYFLSMIQF